MLLICQHFLFLGGLFNAVISVCLGNAKEWGEKLKSKVLSISSIYLPAVAEQSGPESLALCFW